MSSDLIPEEKTAYSSALKSNAQSSPKRSSGLFTLIIALVLAAFIAATYVYGYPRYLELTAQVEALQKQIGVIQSETVQQDTQQQKDIDRIASTQQELRAQIDYNAEKLAQLPGADQQDWLFAEAEYLLRLANQRLDLEGDWNGALSLLQAADNVLIETRNPRVNKVRHILAEEMLALRSTPSADVDGAVLRIQALQAQIPNLPWLPDRLDISVDNTEKTTAETPVESEHWYTRLYDNVTETLKDLVRIRKRDSVAAPLTPDQHYYLQQNMQLMLEQAQVAVLREQPVIYKRSLERVDEWLKNYLLVDDERTRAAYQALDELKRWRIAPVRPDISASLLELQRLVEQQRRGTGSVKAVGESA